VKLAATETDEKAGAQWLFERGINVETDHLVAVHAGSGSPTKCWSSERFARVADGLQKTGIRVVLIEGPADRTITQAVACRISIAPPRLRDVSLSSVVGVLSQCDAFLGNDSGLTHVAAALGLPTVAVFGPTDPAIWGSRRNNLIAIRAMSGCRCLTRDAQAACNDRVCFGSTPETVLNILQRLLGTVHARLAS
jgi:ADP-heptose:LPS heptosyltransferase